MIDKILHPLEVSTFVNSEQIQNGTKNHSVPEIQSLKYSNYSINNLRANYLSFKGLEDASNLAASLNSGSNLVQIKKQHKGIDPFDVGPFENITKISPKDLIEINYYDNQSDNIARALGPNNNIIAVHKDQFMPEILTHTFVKNLREGRYNRTDLRNYDTDVYTLDPLKIDFKPQEEGLDVFVERALQHLRGVGKDNPNRESVVFIKNFHIILAAMGSRAKEVFELFDRTNYKALAPNVRFVGLVPESEMRPKTQEELMNGEKPKFRLKDFDYIRKVEVGGLTPRQTKSFLKIEGKYLYETFNPYKRTRVSVDKNAIDALVDGCSFNYGGTFPKKALDILSLIASTTAVNKNNITDCSEIVKINITEENVKDFYKNHSDMIKYLKMDDSVFTFAQNVTTKLSDIGGAKEAKEELQKIIEFAKDPQGYLELNPLKKAPKGSILTGPPGTGKTELAKAVAGEAGVPFSALSAPELLKKYLGDSEAALREWHESLVQAAIDSGKNVGIGFIDEIDAIGAKRATGEGASEAKASILNQLLTILNGFNDRSDVHIVFLAATNRADILDPALKRPGRFDKVIEVPNPQTLEERIEVMEKHIKNLPFENEAQKSKILKEIAGLTDGLSGAELANLVNITKEIVSNKTESVVATYDDMYEGFMQAIMGKKTYTESSLEDRITIAIHEAGHATLADVLGTKKLAFISNEARGGALGITFFQKSKALFQNFSTEIKKMAGLYAGGVSESLFNPIGHCSGVNRDYETLTQLAEIAIKTGGLGVFTPQISFVNYDNTPNKYLEDLYKDSIKKDIELFTQTAKKISERVMDFHKDFLKDLYIPKFEEEVKSGKGGNILSGEAFREMRMGWIKSNGKLEAYEALQKEIEQIIEDAQKSGKSIEEIAKKSKINPKYVIAAAGVTALGGLAYLGKYVLTENNAKATTTAKQIA